MRRTAISIIVCVGWAATGCTSSLIRPHALNPTAPAESRSSSAPSLSLATRPAPSPSASEDEGVVWAEDGATTSDEAAGSDEAVATDEGSAADESVGERAIATDETAGADPATGMDDPTSAEDDAKSLQADPFADDAPSEEEIPTPPPAAETDVVPGAMDDDQDRFARQVTDVPLDIRPPKGDLPPDLAPEEVAGSNAEQRGRPGSCTPDGREPIVCSFTPWTICYRPLYFEDIELERYGRTFGVVQPAVSAAHFFCSLPIMPYKLTARPPRSCECSNGFSRLGDMPLPGYGDWVFSLDAAAVEAAVMTGLVLALP